MFKRDYVPSLKTLIDEGEALINALETRARLYPEKTSRYEELSWEALSLANCLRHLRAPCAPSEQVLEDFADDPASFANGMHAEFLDLIEQIRRFHTAYLDHFNYKESSGVV